ncbi:MAG: glycosyl transferase, family 9 [Parachlamydiales bacterium]|nr:glycosyl transferase, family 9 [Parachlamydiales bacterium]
MVLQSPVMKSWKNRLLRFLAPKRSPSSGEPRKVQRLLVVSTTALGDTLWATPALANLRMHYPNARIAVLTRSIGMEVLQFNPHIDCLYLLREPLFVHFFSLLKKLRKEHFDAALIFHASQRLVLPLCSLSHIPRIIGTAGINKGLDDLLTEPVIHQNEHEIARRLALAAQIQVPSTIETLSYYVQDDERRAAEKFIGEAKRPLIAMHPGSKEPFRRWPAYCFAKVAQALQKRFDAEIFLTGTAAEFSLLQEIRTQVPNARIVPVSSIRFLGALLERMDLVISNDTGPLHLACALKRPTISIYVSTDPMLCGPFKAPNSSVISRPPTCRPCIKRRCRDPLCFLQISPQEVIDECVKLLCIHAHQ